MLMTTDTSNPTEHPANPQAERPILRLVQGLRQLKEDRGVMANLRRGLNTTTQHYAWPHLARAGGKVDDPVHLLVAALFSLHSREDQSGLGSACRRLVSRSSLPVEDHPLTKRFQRLLAADSLEELAPLIRSLMLQLKREEVPLSYTRLAVDLEDFNRWPERRLAVKTRWAGQFWNAPLLADTPEQPAEPATSEPSQD